MHSSIVLDLPRARLPAFGALHGRQWQSHATSPPLHALYLSRMLKSSPLQRQTVPLLKQALNFPYIYRACRPKQSPRV